MAVLSAGVVEPTTVAFSAVALDCVTAIVWLAAIVAVTGQFTAAEQLTIQGDVLCVTATVPVMVVDVRVTGCALGNTTVAFRLAAVAWVTMSVHVPDCAAWTAKVPAFVTASVVFAKIVLRLPLASRFAPAIFPLLSIKPAAVPVDGNAAPNVDDVPPPPPPAQPVTQLTSKLLLESNAKPMVLLL